MRQSKQDDVISFSKLDTFLRCKWMYFLEYVLKLDVKPNAAMIRGRNTHELAEGLSKSDSIEDVEEIMKGYPVEEVLAAKNFAAFTFGKRKPFGPELYILLKIAPRLRYEGHIDLPLITDDGVLQVYDIKTSRYFKSKVALAEDPQLKLYAWAMTEFLKLKHPELMKAITRVEMGHYNWYYGSGVLVPYDGEDMREFLIKTKKDMDALTEPDNAPKEVNIFCGGCSQINSCVPDNIPDTHEGINNKIKMLEKQLEIKKAHIIKMMDELGVEEVESQEDKGFYYLTKRKNVIYDTDELLKKAAPEQLKPFIKISKKAMDESGVKIEGKEGEPAIFINFTKKAR